MVPIIPVYLGRLVAIEQKQVKVKKLHLYTVYSLKLEACGAVSEK